VQTVQTEIMFHPSTSVARLVCTVVRLQ